MYGFGACPLALNVIRWHTVLVYFTSPAKQVHRRRAQQGNVLSTQRMGYFKGPHNEMKMTFVLSAVPLFLLGTKASGRFWYRYCRLHEVDSSPRRRAMNSTCFLMRYSTRYLSTENVDVAPK